MKFIILLCLFCCTLARPRPIPKCFKKNNQLTCYPSLDPYIQKYKNADNSCYVSNSTLNFQQYMSYCMDAFDGLFISTMFKNYQMKLCHFESKRSTRLKCQHEKTCDISALKKYSIVNFRKILQCAPCPLYYKRVATDIYYGVQERIGDLYCIV